MTPLPPHLGVSVCSHCVVVLLQGYGVAVARAVAELRVLAELCLPFVQPGGVWVAAKGANPEVSSQLARVYVQICVVCVRLHLKSF